MITLTIGGGLALFIVSTLVIGSWAWILGPVVGLVTAFGAATGRGVDLLGDHLGVALLVTASTLLAPVLLIAMQLGARASKARRTKLIRSGAPAVAHVRGAESTGVWVNEQPMVQITYTIQPVSGLTPFAYKESAVIGPTDVRPRHGLAWPASYNPDDTSEVVVRRPDGAPVDQETVHRYEALGLTLEQGYGYDPLGGLPPLPVNDSSP